MTTLVSDKHVFFLFLWQPDADQFPFNFRQRREEEREGRDQTPKIEFAWRQGRPSNSDERNKKK